MPVGTVVVFAFKERLTSVLRPEIAALKLLNSVREPKPRVLLDMSAVRVLDGSGIGLLAALHRVARSLGGDLRLFGLQERAGVLLEACGLLRVFETFENEEAALASIVEPDDSELYLERALAFPYVSQAARLAFVEPGRGRP